MSTKKMLLTLAVASAAVFALPAAASAQEAHIEGITSFTGTASAVALGASGEPTFTCDSADITNGVVNAGGTTGSMGLDFTGCHTSVFGFTAKCRTTGSALDNTILSSGVFHMITVSNKPGMMVTLAPTVIICAGISSITYEGNLIGTLTSPACGVASNTMTVAFVAAGAVQNDKSYTGVNYNLTAQTSGGAKLEAGLNSTATLSSAAAAKVNCT
jgi:hypothetical protein